MSPEGAPKPKTQEALKERLSRVQQLIAARSQDAASLVRTWLHHHEERAQKRNGARR